MHLPLRNYSDNSDILLHMKHEIAGGRHVLSENCTRFFKHNPLYLENL